MKKTNLLLVLFLVSWCFSCKEYPDHLSVLMEQSGTVTIEMVDENKQPLKGAEVWITSTESFFNESGFTDVKGRFTSSELLDESYMCYFSLQVGKLRYRDQCILQVIPGRNTLIKLNPLANSGSIEVIPVTLISGTAQTKFSELNIALVNDPLLSIDQIRESAYEIIEMNKENTFSNIPVGLYYIVAYNKKTGYKYGYSDVEVERGETKVAYVNFPV